ncbi:MAG: hypothetical protein R3E73_07455 [Porticoccaceae bacterium]
MEKPRHLTSLVIRLLQDEKLQPASYVGKVPGVEDLVIIPGQGVAYFKVDNERFDREAFEAALGRECSLDFARESTFPWYALYQF